MPPCRAGRRESFSRRPVLILKLPGTLPSLNRAMAGACWALAWMQKDRTASRIVSGSLYKVLVLKKDGNGFNGWHLPSYNGKANEIFYLYLLMNASTPVSSNRS